jgi:putative membrane protein
METAMKNFMIAAAAFFASAGLLTSAQAYAEMRPAAGTSEYKSRPTTNANEFAQDVLASGMFEIQSSTVALEKSDNDAIKNFARKMVHDHEEADQKLKETLKQANLPEPKYGMNAHQQDLVNRLTVEQGPAFDRKYVEDQIKGHEEAVSLLETYSQGGDNEALRKLASALLPTIKEHLQMAEGLRSSATARR